MTDKDETIPGAFHALVTGYDILCPSDYAELPASSLPELSLAGDKPFTLYTIVCFKKVQRGAILRQEDTFQFGIMDGLLYVGTVHWCAVKFNEDKMGRLLPNRWYTVALTYDGSLLTLYLDGEKKDQCKCTLKQKYVSSEDFTIGNNLYAYFKTLRFFSRALSGKEIGLMDTDAGTRPEDSIAWFQFDKTEKKDQGPKHIRLITRGLAGIMIVRPVRHLCIHIDRQEPDAGGKTSRLFDGSEPIDMTDCHIRSKPGDNHRIWLTGTVTSATSGPVCCELEGEIVTLWDDRLIARTD